jgi:hypothetical protein
MLSKGWKVPDLLILCPAALELAKLLVQMLASRGCLYHFDRPACGQICLGAWGRMYAPM